MDVELRATHRVSDLIAKCERLKPLIDANDRTPFTDGTVDIYSSSPPHSKSTAIGRVNVQVKGRTGKPTKNPKYQFHVDDLKGFRMVFGVVFFLVLMNKQGEDRKVYYIIFNPFRIDAITKDLEPNQTKVSIPLKPFPSETDRIESIFKLAKMKQSEHSALKLPIENMTEIQSLLLFTSDNIDFSVPQEINSEEHDFLLRIESESGSMIPDISTLRIIPETYRDTVTNIVVSAGDTEFVNPTRRRTSPNSIELQLSGSLSLIQTFNSSGVTNQLSLTEPASIAEQKKDLDFFLYCVRKRTLSIDGSEFRFQSVGQLERLPDLQTLHDSVNRIFEVLSILQCDPHLVSPDDIDAKRARQLLNLHKILNGKESLNDTFQKEGRILQPLGSWNIELLALKNDDTGDLECFSLFDSSLKRSFAMSGELPDGSEVATLVTPYELINEDHLESTLNLNLSQIVDFYNDLIEIPEIFKYANQFVLRLLNAGDHSEMRGQEFLNAAESLNQWLLANETENFHNRINHWQIEKRRGKLSPQTRNEIRSLKSAIQYDSRHSLSKHAEVSCSILLEDWEQVDFELTQLSAEDYSILTGWPIWNLRPPCKREDGSSS